MEEYFLSEELITAIYTRLTHPETKLYAYLLSTYKAGTMFQIGKPIREEIAIKCKMCDSAIANGLSTLKQKGFLYSPNRSVYMLNPRYAFQGSTGQRREAIKTIIELGCENC